MSIIESINKGPVVRPRRVTLYGPHGIGKSTFAASAPSPIFLNIEDGLADIDCDSFPVAGNFQTVMEQLGALYNESHEYMTVVIDSVDWLERLIWNEVCSDNNKKAIEDFGYGKGYVIALDLWRRVIKAMTALRDHRGMTAICLAHSHIVKFENPGLDSYDRYEPKLHKKASGLLQEWSDEVLFGNFKVFVRKADEKFGQTRNLAVGSGERMIHTEEQPGFVAKSRLDIPGELPLKWEAFAKYISTTEEETNG